MIFFKREKEKGGLGVRFDFCLWNIWDRFLFGAVGRYKVEGEVRVMLGFMGLEVSVWNVVFIILGALFE